MGRSHSKSEKTPTFNIINEKAPLSPRQKREKPKKESERKRHKKSSFMKKTSKSEKLKIFEPPPVLDINAIFNEDDFEVEVKRHMQDQLAFNSDIFVLNQMMMSLEFFANYERFVKIINFETI